MRFALLLTAALFMAASNCRADDPDRERIFYFNSLEHGEESFVSYLDETYIGDAYLHRDSIYFPTLIPGRTYLLKVTYDYNNVDSCFVNYNYIPESYEIDGFWTYANSGTLAEPNGFYGFYNIDHDQIINYDEYPDASEEDLFYLETLAGFHFKIVLSNVICIKIEIYEYFDQ